MSLQQNLFFIIWRDVAVVCANRKVCACDEASVHTCHVSRCPETTALQTLTFHVFGCRKYTQCFVFEPLKSYFFVRHLPLGNGIKSNKRFSGNCVHLHLCPCVYILGVRVRLDGTLKIKNGECKLSPCSFHLCPQLLIPFSLSASLIWLSTTSSFPCLICLHSIHPFISSSHLVYQYIPICVLCLSIYSISALIYCISSLHMLPSFLHLLLFVP